MSAGRATIRYLVPGAFFFAAIAFFHMVYSAIQPGWPDVVRAVVEGFDAFQVLVLLLAFAMVLGVLYDTFDSTVHISAVLPFAATHFDAAGQVLRGLSDDEVKRITGRRPVWIDRDWDPERFSSANRLRSTARTLLVVLGLWIEPCRRAYRDSVEHNRQTLDALILRLTSSHPASAEAERCKELYDRGRMLGACRAALSAAFFTFVAIAAYQLSSLSGDRATSEHRAALAATAPVAFLILGLVTAWVVSTDRRRQSAAWPGSRRLQSDAQRLCVAVVVLAVGLVTLVAASGLVLMVGVTEFRGLAMLVGGTVLPLIVYLGLYRLLNTARRQLQERRMAIQTSLLRLADSAPMHARPSGVIPERASRSAGSNGHRAVKPARTTTTLRRAPIDRAAVDPPRS